MKLYLIPGRTRLKDNGFTLKEEEEIYDNLLQEVYDNPRYFLDNLDSMTLFRVSWHDYRSKHAVLPLKHINKPYKSKGL